jgi:hypothetical protein
MALLPLLVSLLILPVLLIYIDCGQGFNEKHLAFREQGNAEAFPVQANFVCFEQEKPRLFLVSFPKKIRDFLGQEML